MKKSMAMFLLASCVALFAAGCASNPFYGGVFTQVSLPVGHLHAPVDAVKSEKVGTGSCTNILGLIAVGDASLETVMKSAEITKIHHVDSSYMSFLFIFSQYTVKVYGE